MIQAEEFSADEYDVDGSGAVGWYEFVTVWRKAEACRQGFPFNLPTTVFARNMLPNTVTLQDQSEKGRSSRGTSLNSNLGQIRRSVVNFRCSNFT